MENLFVLPRLITTGVLLLVTLQLGSCTQAFGRRPGAREPMVAAYAADMNAAVDGARSCSRILVHGGMLRLEAADGRRSSVMIARYDLDRLWVLVPGEARFREVPLAARGTQFPHFFDPRISMTREPVGRDQVDNVHAIKYRVRILSDEGRVSEGSLWEAVDLPGFPLKWEDDRANVSVLWKNARLEAVPLSLFSVPEHYAEICADGRGVGRGNRCKK